MTTIADVLADLTAPFPLEHLELKPGAFTERRDRALALPYADARVYQDRLDAVLSPEGWQQHIQLTPMGVVCTLTILGVTKAEVGDYPLDEATGAHANKATTATAQAFKRACAAFGVGRYLYQLPRMWAAYDPEQGAFVDPQGIMRALYRQAGFAPCVADPDPDAVPPTAPDAPSTRPSIPRTSPSAPTPAPAQPDPDRLARARTALAAAERPTRTPSDPSDTASEAQLGLLARLLIGLGQRATDAPTSDDLRVAVDRLGDEVGVAALSQLTSRAKLRAHGLSKGVASGLISRVQALEASLTPTN